MVYAIGVSSEMDCLKEALDGQKIKQAGIVSTKKSLSTRKICSDAPEASR